MDNGWIDSFDSMTALHNNYKLKNRDLPGLCQSLTSRRDSEIGKENKKM